ncbi:glycosyltransferase [Chryseobacterium sp.]|uniref:glycosyltransferase n=1 Tax=Chryseobacterium sp. TaxID=1871047 RepID=UPI0012A9A309|nr:glycosyltransferase [Chryseobacterium sp.]QFG53334.1 glycosyltransferase family 1 protein [Chryseobacterium sp.]
MVNHDYPKPANYDMIVFCHLRWDFVYQRPQHLISRLAKDYKVLVIEEPVPTRLNGKGPFEIKEVYPNVHVCRPPVNSMNDIGRYLRKKLPKNSFRVGWFYSPAFVSVLEELDFDTVVYDCMDELTLFRGASPELVGQEKALMSAADVVYTGGKSLYESKAKKHHNVHCFPSSVDIEHFSGKNGVQAEKPADMLGIPGTVVGYYGVIDERIDLNLLKKTAALAPEISFVMVGPLCKISENDLPKAENIYYLGMKSYEELPAYLHHFDIAMMPFALNDSTRFISPTKTLEYMAANKPIISTRIKDVERDYSHCIMLIDNEQDFLKAITNPERNFSGSYAEILMNTSWDRTAKKMGAIIEKTLAV